MPIIVNSGGRLDKRTPHYDLASIQATFVSEVTLNITFSSRNSAFALGLNLDGVVALVQKTTRTHFYKSMTSNHDHRIWQDVYHVPHGDLTLYVKFTTDPNGYLLISLKEK